MSHGLVPIQNGGYFGRYGIGARSIPRIRHHPPLGIENAHFHLGRGGVGSGYPLQISGGRGSGDMRGQKPGLAAKGFLYLGAQGLLHHLAQGKVEYRHPQEEDDYEGEE
jgi:hypothetical protein